MPDEIRLLDNHYAILFIRGARPVMDLKYELMNHPNIGFSSLGGGKPYTHKGTIHPVYIGEPLFAANSETSIEIEKESDLLE